MNGEGQRLQTLNQRGCRRIQKFVANAEDPLVARGCSAMPATFGNDFLQRHAIARAAPGRNDYLRIQA